MDGIVFQSDQERREYAMLKARLFLEFKPSGRSQEKVVTSATKALFKLGRVQRLSVNN